MSKALRYRCEQRLAQARRDVESRERSGNTSSRAYIAATAISEALRELLDNETERLPEADTATLSLARKLAPKRS